jgi:hypothetical protein
MNYSETRRYFGAEIRLILCYEQGYDFAGFHVPNWL